MTTTTTIHEHGGTRVADHDHTIVCDSGGTASLVLRALIAILALGVLGAAFVVPLDATARAVMIAGALVMIALVSFGAWRTLQERGKTVFDVDARTITRSTGSFRFDDIQQVSTLIDMLERNPAALVHGPAHWLRLEMKNGRRFVLCKGFDADLKRVVAHLEQRTALKLPTSDSFAARLHVQAKG